MSDDRLNKIQIQSALKIFQNHSPTLNFSYSDISVELIEKLENILYKVNHLELSNDIPDDVVVVPYTKNDATDYTIIEKSQLCHKYHCVNEILFLVSLLELKKPNLLYNIHGVMISAKYKQLVFLKNSDYDGTHILQLNIPGDIDLQLSIMLKLHHNNSSKQINHTDVSEKNYESQSVLYSAPSITTYLIAFGIGLCIVSLTVRYFK